MGAFDCVASLMCHQAFIFLVLLEGLRKGGREEGRGGGANRVEIERSIVLLACFSFSIFGADSFFIFDDISRTFRRGHSKHMVVVLTLRIRRPKHGKGGRGGGEVRAKAMGWGRSLKTLRGQAA